MQLDDLEELDYEMVLLGFFFYQMHESLKIPHNLATIFASWLTKLGGYRQGHEMGRLG